MSTIIALLTLIVGVISGVILNMIAMRISFKQRTIDNKIKVYDSLIANWIAMRDHIFHYNNNDSKWLEFDKLYSRTQTYIGEAFLVSDNLQLLEDIDSFNEKFAKTNWHDLTVDKANTTIGDFKKEGKEIIKRMKADIHESTKFTFNDFLTIFK